MNARLLKEKLREFGLNPSEWAVEVRHQFGRLTHMELRSTVSQSFQLEGWAEQDHWVSLTMRD